ncbi:esterase B1-like [Bactrocera neohumeralis]|uniref:esterase B1-like n=1 Tax=Bactrocera neohumeralis TaxID=98809 RepID=UPI00216666AE|nr:esterase B1-like [Bactrocera neohumeralis]
MDSQILEPIVSTANGKVRGQLREGIYGDTYYSFDGIPYAKPPLGKLRFKSPQPVEPWLGVRDCTICPAKCMQSNRYNGAIEGIEDCLYLNVFTKKLLSAKPLPVLAYLIGGRFTTGDASRNSWGPDYFMMKDVILISIGFRLGALGFLSFPEPELQVPGNAGLKDIVMALQWIKKNCQYFNGDSDNITLFGHSSGSQAAQLLMYLPQCENLFHKVILMSGMQMHLRRIPQLEYRFAKHLGYKGEENNHDILAYLSALPAERLCNLQIWTPEELKQGHFFVFSLTLENESAPDAILTKDPLDMYANKHSWCHSIPLVLGGNSFESLMHYKYFTKQPELYETLRKHPEYLLSHEVREKSDVHKQQQLARKLIHLHLGAKELHVEQSLDVMRLSSYDFMYHPIYRYLKTRIPNAKAPTYFYRFDFDSPYFNLYRIKHCGREVRGVSHVDELSYLFLMPDSFKLQRNSKEFKIIECMIDWITAFALNSDPNCEKLSSLVWEPLKADTHYCLNISDELSFVKWPEEEMCVLWDQYFKEAGIRTF